jgi:hypothetical protein
MVRTISAALVHTMEPASDALGVEEAVRLFSAAFAQVCALKEVQPVTLQRV